MTNMNNERYCADSVFVFVSLILLLASCTNSGSPGLFGKKSPHDSYGDKLKDAGLSGSALGRKWFTAAEHSLTSPLSVNLPYSETGYFAAEEPKAVGIIFQAKRGEKLTISLTKKPTTAFAIYLDLWLPASTNDEKPKLLLSADSATSKLQYEVDKEGSYILRLQPELLKAGEYTLSISTGPTLAFPVTPEVKSNIGSFWGAGRDAGSRKHEGIDIFAPRGTPLVAAANGVVTRAGENPLGGKVIFLRPARKDYTLYYAHLDKQIAAAGQTVTIGDTIGLVGNTGNARTTQPHLHFGIYTYQGAIDPLPFVNRVIKTPESISASLSNLGKWVRNNRRAKLLSEPASNTDEVTTLEPNTLLKVEAATAGWYKALSPRGEAGFIASTVVTAAATPINKFILKTPKPLLDQPDELAARKTTLPAGKQVNILAMYKDFYFVRHDKEEGWVLKSSL
jgi:murein DD-endopeptidase MepM/ murein hydrolase activator NlpD